MLRLVSDISVETGLFVMESEVGVFNGGFASLGWDVNELIEFVAAFSVDFGWQVHNYDNRRGS